MHDQIAAMQSESLLQVDDQKIAAAMNLMNVGLWEYDSERDEFYFSEQTFRITGLEPCSAPLAFTAVLKLLHPMDAQKFCQHLQMMRRVPINQSYKFVRADGCVRTIRLQSQPPVQNPLQRIAGVMQDITEQQTLENELTDTRKQMQLVQKVLPVGVWSWDVQIDRLNWSNEMFAIWGIEKEEFQPRFEFLEATLVASDRKSLLLSLAEIHKDSRLEKEFRINHTDGTVRYIQAVGEYSFDDMGNLLRVYGVVRDITKQRLAEQALHLSEHRQDWAQKFAHLGFWEHEIGSNSLNWSDETYRIFGLDPGQYVELQDVLDLVYPEDVAYVEKSLRDGMSEPFHIEFRILRPSGDERIVVLQCEGMTGEEINGPIFGFCQDVTELRVAERILKESEELLRKAEKLSVVGQLAAGVAHEIRNPLTALKGFTQLFYSNSDSDSRRYYDIMLSELARIETILGELLVLAKPQTGRYKPQEVGEILQEVISLLGTQAILHSVVIATEFLTQNLLVSCDRNQLKQVFVNVIKNGIEAMLTGGQLTIRMYEDHGNCTLEFLDEGQGIAPEQLQKLGQPFFTTKEKGTGLGLMVSHKIISDHNGELTIDSEVDQGTCVRIVLPAYYEPTIFGGMIQP